MGGVLEEHRVIHMAQEALRAEANQRQLWLWWCQNAIDAKREAKPFHSGTLYH